MTPHKYRQRCPTTSVIYYDYDTMEDPLSISMMSGGVGKMVMSSVEMKFEEYK